VALEKSGQGFPLSSFFPEQYDSFGLAYGVYLRCKSVVIFQLIENRVGGKEHMRISLKQLIRSPPVYNPVTKPYKGANTEVVGNFQSLFESAGNASPMSPNMTPPTPSMVNHALNANEERQRYRSYSEDGSVGNRSPYSSNSPYSVGNMSPYSGNFSPLSQTSGNLSPYAYGYGNISPYPAGNMSPYARHPAGGNMSPYAPYALGAATPAYDAYAHVTRIGERRCKVS
jgi:hypothetical protein